MAASMARTSMECSTSHRCPGPFACVHALRGARAPAPVVLVSAAGERKCPSALAPPRPALGAVPRQQQRRLQPVCAAKQSRRAAKTRPRRAADVDVDKLNEDWGIPGAIEFGHGQGDLPTVLLTHPQTRQQLVVYLYGATIAQWLKTNGTATFYDGPDELYQEGMPLRTGVSVHFPQHRDGQLPYHGFADRMMWEVDGTGFDNEELIDRMVDFGDELDENRIALEDMQERQAYKALAEAQARGEDVEELLKKIEERYNELEAKGELEDDEDEAGDMPIPDFTVMSDLAPFIVLRLRDTPETRKIWPHRFELKYKITLGVQDEMTEGDLRDARISHGEHPDGPKAAELALREQLAAEGMPEAMYHDGEEGEDDEGEDGHTEETAPIVSSRGVFEHKPYMLRDDVRAGPAGEDEVEEEGGEAEEEGEEGEEGEDKPAASATKRRGRPRRQPIAEDSEDAAGAEGKAEAEEDGVYDEVLELPNFAAPEEGTVGPEPYAPAVQIKQEFWLTNLDDLGCEPMRFHLASLARFATLQQPEQSDFVKMLGLGGSQTFDYTNDPRYPVLGICGDDYLHYNGLPRDVTYVSASDATLYLCPGNRTHFEFIQRDGLPDMFVEQPGIDDNPDWQRVASIGAGYVATYKKLRPAEVYTAEAVIRFHNRYWPTPIFGEDAMPPLPPLSGELLQPEAEEGDDLAAFDGVADGAGAEGEQ